MTRTKMSTDYIVSSLKTLFGTNVTAADIKGWCAANGANYQTVTNKIEEFKVSRGRWNLEVTQQKVEEIERSFNQVAVLPEHQQNLIPEKDDTFVKFGNFNDIKKIIQSRIFYPAFITGLSGNGKRSALSKRVLNLSGNLFV